MHGIGQAEAVASLVSPNPFSARARRRASLQHETPSHRRQVAFNLMRGFELNSQAKHRGLARPFRWSIAEAGNADAAREATFDGPLHQIGCEEGEGNHHVNLTKAAIFAHG